MEYIRIKGLDKPISRLIMGTAWFLSLIHI